jgi:type I restriction-modification system DNA methylase subunit
MAKRKAIDKKAKQAGNGENGGIVSLTKAIHDPDEYRRVGAFVISEAARWENLRKAAQADDIKVKLDDVLESLETKYPDKLKGLLPRIYAGSNLDAVSVRGLINLFSKDIFEADHGGDDLIGRVSKRASSSAFARVGIQRELRRDVSPQRLRRGGGRRST